MIRLLVEKELRDSMHSARWAAAFGVSAVLILLSFALGARQHVAAAARHEAARVEDLRQAEGLTDWAALRNHRIFLPPQPLEALVTGVSADVGRTVAVRGRGAPVAEGSRYGEEPLHAAFRFLDLEFLFQVLLSLLVIVFAHDAVCGEKERGTLRLALANPVPRGAFVAGKLAGVCLAVTLPLLAALLLGCLLLPLLGVRLSGDEWLRLALVAATGLLYLGAVAALSVLVSSLTRRAANSFLVLLAVWVAMVLVVPRVSVLLAGRAVPVLSADEVESDLARLRAQIAAEDMQAMAGFQSTPTPDPAVAVAEFQKFMEERAEARQRKLDDLRGRLEERRANQQAAQQRLALGLARLSPATSCALAAANLAGVGLDLPRRFRDQAAAYQQEYARFMVEKTGTNPGDGMVVRMRIGGEEPPPVDPAELPVFRYRPPRASELLPAALLDVALLLLAGLALSAGAVIAFARYDAR